MIVLAELFQLDLQGVDFHLVTQRRTEVESSGAADEAAEQVGLEVVQAQYVGRIGRDLNTALQVGERLTEDVRSLQHGIAGDALELPAVVMAATRDLAIDTADLDAGLKRLLTEEGAAIPPDFHGLTRHGGGVEDEGRHFDVEGLADLQGFQSLAHDRMQRPQKVFVGGEVRPANVREPALEAGLRFEDDRGLLHRQSTRAVPGAHVLDVDSAVGVADAGADVGHGVGKEFRLHGAAANVHGDINVLRLIGTIDDGGLEAELTA